jgi:hypothetical protein
MINFSHMATLIQWEQGSRFFCVDLFKAGRQQDSVIRSVLDGAAEVVARGVLVDLDRMALVAV